MYHISMQVLIKTFITHFLMISKQLVQLHINTPPQLSTTAPSPMRNRYLSPITQFLEEHIIGAELHDEWLKWPRPKPKLALLWATIQAELLTYRRIKIGDGWMSENFSMTALNDWLEGKSATFKTPLVERDMLKEYSTCCGWFLCAGFPTPTAGDVCETHFMNMDIYDRTTFHPQQDIRVNWMDMAMEEES
ncbi:LOW QUALITY PROTEIN: hypothetical protein QC764_0060650 [Podospora pseudoanserina]|uniref:Uncharacterized protein n=1 Tax=Podospora pseudoanserina TaxID=2609844 RepID=A0ABR0I8I4_9PEZI|nr:LOW QUALITY PROTEIN: hypothetical protein QC764_0060650 [Podospora pseudoanserina]